MAETCDLCSGQDLVLAYEPQASRRGLRVYVCAECGLVQSLPRHDRAPREAANISAGADWGNLRYGKGFRVGAHMALLAGRAWSTGAPQILDVGSNRGAFLTAALEAWPSAKITAVEPDERVTSAYETLPQVVLMHNRIEDCAFGEATLDLIYSSHTLEHVASARRVLVQHAHTLRRDGLLLLEVPNIAVLDSKDLVEEWFIDKHLYHFSPTTLRALLAIAGLEIIEGPKPGDNEYLTVLARPAPPQAASAVIDSCEHERASRLIFAASITRARNVNALRTAASAIMSEKGRVVVWGAGRLFDALVREGGLNPSRLAGLIDEGLRKHVADRHGVTLCDSAALADLDADLVVVASRSFAQEIATKVRALSPHSRVLTFAELLDRAQKSAA